MTEEQTAYHRQQSKLSMRQLMAMRKRQNRCIRCAQVKEAGCDTLKCNQCRLEHNRVQQRLRMFRVGSGT